MSDLDKFRADFAAVWRHWRATGQLTESEMKQQMAEAGAAVRKNLSDAAWMQCAAEHFAGLADEIRADQARSERIAAEVMAAREKTTRRAA
jgi:hypothetical protein